jgi:hypothetical protein
MTMPTIDVEAIAGGAGGAQANCNLCLCVGGGYQVTDLSSGEVGYVVWLDIVKACEFVAKLTTEIARSERLGMDAK